MGLRSAPKAIERRPRRLKLWHLAASVMAASIVCGGIKALSRRSTASWSETILAFLAVWILSCSGLIFVSLGTRLGNHVAQRTQEWGIDRGGASGFLIWLVAFALNLTIVLGITALGFVLALGIFFVLFYNA